MKELGHRICNLLTIKSIVTLILTVCFFILAMRGTISAEVFISVYSVVIGFYFGTQRHKDDSNNKPDIEG
jgi:5-bromo-4-chloroindolyl phosphate hydrolysis protein